MVHGLILPVCFRILQGRATVWSQHLPRVLHKAGFRNICLVAGPELPKSLWQEGLTFPLLWEPERVKPSLFPIGFPEVGVVWTCGVSGQVDQDDSSAYTNSWPSAEQAFYLENIPVAELAKDSLGISDKAQLLDLQALV